MLSEIAAQSAAAEVQDDVVECALPSPGQRLDPLQLILLGGEAPLAAEAPAQYRVGRAIWGLERPVVDRGTRQLERRSRQPGECCGAVAHDTERKAERSPSAVLLNSVAWALPRADGPEGGHPALVGVG